MGGRRHQRDLDALENKLLAGIRGELLAQSNAINARIDAMNGQMKTLMIANSAPSFRWPCWPSASPN